MFVILLRQPDSEDTPQVPPPLLLVNTWLLLCAGTVMSKS